MDLKTFRALYASTFAHEPLLADFWSAAVYDLEGSFESWVKTRKGIEANALRQRQLLEELFAAVFPQNIDELMALGNADPEELAALLKDYPALLKGNEGKLRVLVGELPANGKTHLLSLLVV